MKPKNILVPIDFGESAGSALRYARDLAGECGAVLHVLHVIQYPLANGPDETARERCRKKESVGLGRVKGLLGTIDAARIKPICRVGTPLIEIVEYAATHDIDLIVMGTHWRLPTPQMITPSVTDGIVRQAPCPVLVVQAPAHELVA